MTRLQTDLRSHSKREKDHARMLEAALARPGVREFMKVYGNWQEADRALDIHRSTTRRAEQVTTRNSSSAC